MPLTPDGEREVFELKYPVNGSRSRTVIISGLGLPTKIVVGAPDLPDETHLSISNRDRNGRAPFYDTVETIELGSVSLHAKPYQGSDQSFSAKGGALFCIGALAAPNPITGDVAFGPKIPGDKAAWLITTENSKFICVSPHSLDSYRTRDFIRRLAHGVFTVEMISAGTFTAADDHSVPGIRTITTPSYPPRACIPD